MVRLPKNFQFLRCDVLSGYPDRQSRPRKRVPADHVVGQAQLTAKHSNLVLEEFSERLHEAHIHAFRQAAHVVMRLDRDARAAVKRNGFNDIRVERALRQEVRATDLLRFLFEHIDE